MRKGYLSSLWQQLDEITTNAHRFVLGLKTNPGIGQSITSLEYASTRSVELTLRVMISQLPYIASQNPLTLTRSPIIDWLRKEHPILSPLPTKAPNVTFATYKSRISEKLNGMKRERLQQYTPRNHPIPHNNRNPNNLIDNTLRCPDVSLMKHLVYWRGNLFGRGSDRLCVCLHAFDQSHMRSCAINAGIPIIEINDMIANELWNVLKDYFEAWWSICDAANGYV